MRHVLANPWALYLLLCLPALAVVGYVARLRRRRALARLGSLAAQAGLVAAPPWRRTLRGLCLFLGTVALVVGIAGPQWGLDSERSVARGRDLVVVLDVSWSMFAETPRNRLERARDALLDLYRTVKNRGGHRLALVTFAARPRVDCPLTHDYDHFRDAVEQLDLTAPPPDLLPNEKDRDESGTRVSRALLTALAALNNPDFQGAQAVLLISDGDDPVGGDDWEKALAEARRQNVPVPNVPIHAVGVGDPEAASRIPTAGGYLTFQGQEGWTRLEEKPLERIAELSGGTYTKAHAKDLPLGDLFRRRIEPGGVRETAEDSLPLYRPRYAWFLAPALALLALALAVHDRPAARRRPRSGPPGPGEKKPKSVVSRAVPSGAASGTRKPRKVEVPS